MTYKVITSTDYDGTETSILERTNDDGSVSFIPMDEANSDYQRYLNPEAEQSTPIVKDEPAAKK
jgi:hypothetical protein